MTKKDVGEGAERAGRMTIYDMLQLQYNRMHLASTFRETLILQFP